MFNVLKIMNKIDISQDKVALTIVSRKCRLWCYFKVFAILSHLPRRRNGKIQVEEFINLPIISEDAFKAIDRNKDGFLTRGELKMSNKSASMGEVGEVIEEHDQNYDKKLNILEYRGFLEDEVKDSMDEFLSHPFRDVMLSLT